MRNFGSLKLRMGSAWRNPTHGVSLEADTDKCYVITFTPFSSTPNATLIIGCIRASMLIVVYWVTPCRDQLDRSYRYEAVCVYSRMDSRHGNKGLAIGRTEDVANAGVVLV